MDPLASVIAQSPELSHLRQNQMLSPEAMQQWKDLIDTSTTGRSQEAGASRFQAGPAATGITDGVGSFVQEVDSKIKDGEALREGLLTGEPVNLHQATIALQEASVSFTLMMEFRNKLMEGYQELMRMQV